MMFDDFIYQGKVYELRVADEQHGACESCAAFAIVDFCHKAENCCTSVPDGYFVEKVEKGEMSEMLLPTDSRERKQIPITSGVLDYFPLAIAEVAKASYAGNQQHHEGSALHWDKSKSTDHSDCISRHLIDRGKVDSDGIRHSAKLAWRALALLQIELETEKE